MEQLQPSKSVIEILNKLLENASLKADFSRSGDLTVQGNKIKSGDECINLIGSDLIVYSEDTEEQKAERTKIKCLLEELSKRQELQESATKESLARILFALQTQEQMLATLESGIFKELNDLERKNYLIALQNLTKIMNGIWQGNYSKDNEELIRHWCLEIKKFRPDEFLADFCLTVFAAGKDKRKVREFLSKECKDRTLSEITFVLHTMLHALEKDYMLPVSRLLEDYRNAGGTLFDYFRKRYDEEKQRVDSGVYSLTLKRHVFVAYNREDIDRVLDIVSYLEERGLSCFVATRNLRQCDGAAYDKAIETAIDNCRVFLFVSSVRSRTECGAYTEMQWVKEQDEKMFKSGEPAKARNARYVDVPRNYKKMRVEYQFDYYGRTFIDDFVKEFFYGLNPCTDLETLKKTLASYLNDQKAWNSPVEQKTPPKQYCVSCLTEAPKSAKFCPQCGKTQFLPTLEAAKEQNQRQTAIEKEKKAAEEKAKQEAAEQAKKAAEEQAQKETEEKVAPKKPEGKVPSPKPFNVDEAIRVVKMSSPQVDMFLSSKRGKEFLRIYFEKGFRPEGKSEAYYQVFASSILAEMARMGIKVGSANYDKLKAALDQKEGRTIPTEDRAQERKKQEAIARQKEEAHKKEVEQWVQLAEDYYEGIKKPRDLNKALEFAKKAAKEGHPRAECLLGHCYYVGLGVPKSFNEAVKLFMASAAQGYGKAQWKLGVCYYYGQGVDRSPEKAVEWFTKAANQGLAIAQCDLGGLYAKGEGVLKSPRESFEWYFKAAMQGFVLAQVSVALRYERGEGVEKSLEAALEWFEKAEKGGHSIAAKRGIDRVKKEMEQASKVVASIDTVSPSTDEVEKWAQLAEDYFYGKNGQMQLQNKAVEYARKAAMKGSAMAQFRLGFCYDYGKGTFVSKKDAFDWYEKAAAQGHLEAMFRLGWLYCFDKSGLPLDQRKGWDLMERSAIGGCMVAQYALGTYYETGKIVGVFLESAIEWYQKAAKCGHAGAIKRLEALNVPLPKIAIKPGSLSPKEAEEYAQLAEDFFAAKNGKPKNPAKTFEYAHIAAEAGNVQAQFRLAYCYDCGFGVKASKTNSFEWYLKSATQGFVDAFIPLAEHYENGLGVEKSLPMAITWYKKAAEKGSPFAKKRLKELKVE